MRFGVNLRGDLAKLTDEALAANLEDCLQERERLVARLRSDRRNRLDVWLAKHDLSYVFGRGPLHARIFYKLRARLTHGSLHGSPIGPIGGVYVLECEIKDIRDEMQRRVSARRADARAHS